MPNVKQIISSHNKNVLKKTEPKTTVTKTCNCRDHNKCPLDNKCLTSGVICQATVTRQDIGTEETYIGLTENTFKARYSAHMSNFRNENNRYSTTLSEYVWTLQDKKVPYNLKWKIISKSNPYSTSSKKCNLCIEEKYFIIIKPNLSWTKETNLQVLAVIGKNICYLSTINHSHSVTYTSVQNWHLWLLSNQ